MNHNILMKDRPENKPQGKNQKDARVSKISSFAIEVWGDEQLAEEFMKKPHPMLGGKTPYEASQSESGAEQTEAILGRIKFGISA